MLWLRSSEWRGPRSYLVGGLEGDPNGFAYEIAEVYARRDDAKATFESLDRFYKDDPRFAAFYRKAGLPVPGETSLLQP